MTDITILYWLPVMTEEIWLSGNCLMSLPEASANEFILICYRKNILNVNTALFFIVVFEFTGGMTRGCTFG